MEAVIYAASFFMLIITKQACFWAYLSRFTRFNTKKGIEIDKDGSLKQGPISSVDGSKLSSVKAAATLGVTYGAVYGSLFVL